MNEKEIIEFVKPYEENYGWDLIARCGNGNQINDTYIVINKQLN